MANLGGIRANAVKAQQHEQRNETGIIRPWYFRMYRHFDPHIPVVLPYRASGKSMLIGFYPTDSSKVTSSGTELRGRGGTTFKIYSQLGEKVHRQGIFKGYQA
jgi:hypothetical protein